MQNLFKKNYPIIIFFIVALVITTVWFRDGNHLGGGEAGAPYQNLSQMVGITVWAWGSHMLGAASGTTVASGPMFCIFNILQSLGVAGFLIQAGLFLSVIFLTQYSMYKLTKFLFPNIKELAFFSAAFFYLFNSYSMMNIWNRFLPNIIVFYALLPLVLWIFLKGIIEKRLVYVFLIALITTVFSYAFGAPAQSVIFWFILFFTAAFSLLFLEKPSIKNALFVTKFIAILFVSWIILNFWWISQEIYFLFSFSYSTATELFFTDLGNLRTMNALSNSLGQLINLLLLKHGTFFVQSRDLPYAWPLFYSNPASLFIEWLVFILIISTVFISKRSKWTIFLIILFLIGLFGALVIRPLRLLRWRCSSSLRL